MKEAVRCQRTKTPRTGAGSSARTGWRDSATACSDAYARHQHLYAPKEEGEELHSTQRKFLPVVIGYVIAILIGLALPAAAVVLFFGIAVYVVVLFREAARVLIRRRSSRQ